MNVSVNWDGIDDSIQQFKNKDGYFYCIAYGGFKMPKSFDFENPDKNLITNIVWRDFAHKLWMLYYENIHYPIVYGVGIYSEFFDHFVKKIQYYNSDNHIILKKDVCDYASDTKELCNYIAHYFNEQLRNMPQFEHRISNRETIQDLFGGGEFPFVYASLLKISDDNVKLFYKISR